jgi:ATP-dependent Clp protease protease subunit
MSNIVKDFKLFARDKGVSSMVVDDVMKYNQNIITPYILEERINNTVSIDIYSRLLFDRIMYFGHEVNSETCNVAIAQLLFLDSINNNNINFYINSGGGSVIDGLGLIDTINVINSPISTTCVGMAASMGAVLLSCGEKGNRFVLPHSRVMIHQVSSTTRGTVSDMKIALEQSLRCEEDVYTILANNTNKTVDEIRNLCDRDNWFIGQEAVDLGIADKVLCKKNS